MDTFVFLKFLSLLAMPPASLAIGAIVGLALLWRGWRRFGAVVIALACRRLSPAHQKQAFLWGSVGVVATAEYRERLGRAGIGSIEPAAGLRALDKLMAAPLQQLAFVTTTKPWNLADENIRAYGASAPSVMEAIVRTWPVASPETREAGWHERLTADLTALAAEVIGVPMTAIDGA